MDIVVHDFLLCYTKKQMLTFQEKIQRLIKFSFYALFFITPFAMTNVNHELFEFNKMLLVYLFAVFIFFLWGLRMISEKRFFVRRTVLDIPILLFLASQIISTVISIDPHTSFWGYYSRFNGGLLSMITYVFLYYALVSNFFFEKEEAKDFAKKILGVSILSGTLVALWGIPSHFGYDPTCMVFGRGLNTACWTEAFNPTARIFSTLGQPNWLAAYLAILLPVSLSFLINLALPLKKLTDYVKNPKIIFFAVVSMLFYIAIVWTNSQSGFIGLWIGLFVFIGMIKLVAFKKNGFSPKKLLKLNSIKILALFVILFLGINFLIGNPFPRFQGLSVEGLKQKTQTENAPAPQETVPAGPSLENNITGSGEIRLIVWRGALDIFKANPLIGSGVETFAYAYYKHRPAEHNLTSEWDYLYNKAHNEYLNYLATTGLLGFGTYMAFIFVFLFVATKYFLTKKSITDAVLPAAIVGSFISILVSNFFGFSVVLANLYLFLLPAVFLLYIGKRNNMLSYPKKTSESNKFSDFKSPQYFVLAAVGFLSLYLIWGIINYWSADKDYALGYNFNRIDEYVRANQPLEDAVSKKPGEHLYKNELSSNLASLALAFAQDNQPQNAAVFAQRAKALSDEVMKDNPNNIVYYKTRARTLFTLAQIQPEILDEAYQTILKAQELAPTDAKITYNKALIEEVVQRPLDALKTLDETIKLKPNYLDAYYRSAIVLISLSEEETDAAKADEYRTLAKERLTFITTKLAPDFAQARELLKSLE